VHAAGNGSRLTGNEPVEWTRASKLCTPSKADTACRMSHENVELFRRAVEAFNARDLERFIALFDPDVEFHSSFSGVSAVYHGHEGLRRWHQDLEDAWGDEIRSEPEAYFYLGDYTLTLSVLRGRGRHSEVEVETPDVLVARWRDGLIVYLKSYLNKEEALGELGLSESKLEPSNP
jgi:ketosteroid isomerase-like protein